MGAWLGIDFLTARFARFKTGWKNCVVLFIASIALCNTALWAIDLFIAHSSDFYGRYLAGETQQLIAAADYFKGRNVRDGEISVSPYYLNLGRQRPNGQGLRCMHMLTGRGIHVISKKICTGEPNKRLLEWAPTKEIKYYLYRPPVSPWRAHHFRITWIQRLLTGQKDIPENPSWILYELGRDRAIRIDLPKPGDYSHRVPGM